MGISSDPKCKDITRLSFVSDDLETYKNVHNQIFEVTISETESQTKIQEKEARAYQKSFEDCIQFTEQKENYQTGNRNNFVYLLACNCNRSGIPENEALDLIMTNFDLSEVEIKASVRSAYSHHFNEFANFAKSAKSGKKESIQAPSTETVSEDYLKNTPVIPLEVYNELPDLIKSGAIPITDWREGCLSHRGIGDS